MVNNWDLSPATCKELNPANQYVTEPGSTTPQWSNECGPN